MKTTQVFKLRNQIQTSVSEILNVGPASERSERSGPLFFLQLVPLWPSHHSHIFCVLFRTCMYHKNLGKFYTIYTPMDFAYFFVHIQGIRTQIVKSNFSLRERRMDISDVWNTFSCTPDMGILWYIIIFWLKLGAFSQISFFQKKIFISKIFFEKKQICENVSS